MLVGLDYRGQVRDFYYPQVGLSNHVSGASGSYVHRVGVYADERLVWFDDPSWDMKIDCDAKQLFSTLTATNESLGVTVTTTDVVHNEHDVFLRSFTVRNDRADAREIKLFFSQQFRIDESRRGDTALYDPRVGALVHYKGDVKILINAEHDGKTFADYSVGLFGIEGKGGTFHDAEDGVLERNPVEHGSVDSVIGITAQLNGQTVTDVRYWIACAPTMDEVHALDALVKEETPQALISSTQNYWQAWTEKEAKDLSILPAELQTLYYRSLSTIRVHADNRGGIIASSDTSVLHHGRDDYSYVWPRDASIIAHALDRAGYNDIAKRYFQFMTDRIEAGGYLMHKYDVSGKLGSSWHPWMVEGKATLPIQEDETALTLYMLWRHYEIVRDLEFIESRYNPFIELAADFMCEYMEPVLGLPDNSYDLWEEKYGISTYTASAVYGALTAASQFANVLGKQEPARKYAATAQKIREQIMKHLYDEELGMFVKLAREPEVGETEFDRTLDMSSFFGPVYFGVIEVDDPRMTAAYETVERELRVRSASQGYVRYEGDNYYRMLDADSPNPWVITTLWMAQYHIMKAKTVEELKPAYDILEWTCSHATTSGVLAEQMHPHTREQLSTAPLIWSHAEYVITVDEYTKKYAELTQAN